MLIENRIAMAKHMNKLGFGIGAEIGVADARYSEILCQEIQNLRLYSVDPYSVYKGNWRTKEYQEEAFVSAKKRLENYNVTLIRKTSLEASLSISENSLDFVFIDGDHAFDGVMLDIILWTPKVRRGGIIYGHDYYHHRAGGVVPAVNAYCESHNIELNIIPRFSGGHKDDQAPCWYWIKQ